MKNSIKGLMLVGVVIIAVVVVIYLSNQSSENFESTSETVQESSPVAEQKDLSSYDETPKQGLDGETEQMALFNKMEFDRPEDLLPKDDADKFVEDIDNGIHRPEVRSFVEAAAHVGEDARFGGMKNANLSLRSDPPIPREDVGPWNASTFQPDPYRKQFEIGV